MRKCSRCGQDTDLQEGELPEVSRVWCSNGCFELEMEKESSDEG